MEKAPYVTLSTRFGDFHILKQLGEGSMASVYLAELLGESGFKRRVALKFIHARHWFERPEFVGSFISEARLGGHLQHHNIAQTLFLGEHEGCPFIAMEFVDGPNLRTVLGRTRADAFDIPVSIALQIVGQVCAALDYAHQACDDGGRPLCMVHRDLKPSNLLLTRHGAVKIVDFGVAKATSNLACTLDPNTIKGTVQYMSPEQAAGSPTLDFRSDLFAVGLILYELLTGVPLYEADSLPAMIIQAERADVRTRLMSLPDVSIRAEIHRFLDACLAREPMDRHQSAGEMLDILDTLAVRLVAPVSIRSWVKSIGARLPEFPELVRTSLESTPGIVRRPPELVPEVAGPLSLQEPRSIPGNVRVPGTVAESALEHGVLASEQLSTIEVSVQPVLEDTRQTLVDVEATTSGMSIMQRGIGAASKSGHSLAKSELPESGAAVECKALGSAEPEGEELENGLGVEWTLGARFSGGAVAVAAVTTVVAGIVLWESIFLPLEDIAGRQVAQEAAGKADHLGIGVHHPSRAGTGTATIEPGDDLPEGGQASSTQTSGEGTGQPGNGENGGGGEVVEPPDGEGTGQPGNGENGGGGEVVEPPGRGNSGGKGASEGGQGGPVANPEGEVVPGGGGGLGGAAGLTVVELQGEGGTAGGFGTHGNPAVGTQGNGEGRSGGGSGVAGVGAAGGGISEPHEEALQYGYLQLETVDLADKYLDDIPLGSEPTVWDQRLPGDYSVQVECRGSTPSQGSVRLVAGQISLCRIDCSSVIRRLLCEPPKPASSPSLVSRQHREPMAPPPPEKIVVSPGRGASERGHLSIGGKRQLSSVILPPGKHKVVVDCQGRQSVTRTVVVGAGAPDSECRPECGLNPRVVCYVGT